jgi:hypothetical protein
MRRDMRSLSLALALGIVAGASCLPGDERDPPATVLLMLTSEDTADGVTTVDGWTITIERLLMGVGDTQLGDGDGKSCTRYSDADYRRLLDARLATEQKISVLFGLGRCFIDLGVTFPSSADLLGEGVSEEDRSAMQVVGTDVYSEGGFGVAVDLTATARRDAIVKHVRWRFRQVLRYGPCAPVVDGEMMPWFDLRSGENATFHLGVRGTTLFRDGINDATAQNRFDAMALADVNGDDEVTLEELRAVSIVEARSFGGAYDLDNPGGRITTSTLGDYVYLALLPKMTRFREPITCGLCVPRNGCTPRKL